MEIEIDDVSKQFAGVHALRGVTSRIAAGCKVALVGPNGSGKSTLTRAVLGLITFDGAIRLDGRSPFHHRVEIARRLAYVPQAAPQLAANVADVVRLVSRLRNVATSAIEHTGRRIGLDLSEVADRPVRGLSSGMKQKLMIALAFAGRADLFILDEPTASLDPAARADFYGLFQEVAAKSTLLLSSHRIEEIQHLVDHVLYLDNGRLTFDGSLKQFLQTRAMSIIEVATDAADVPRLEQLGFVRTSVTSWTKVVPCDDKVALAKQVLADGNGEIRNINVRDLETVSHRARESQP